MAEARTLGGRYRLEEEIGRGGIGTVYRAVDLQKRETVAVKVLHSHLNAEASQRFRRGARIASELRGPNIVQVLDYNIDGDEHYLVMEYVEGSSLAELLEDRGRLTEAEVLSIVSQIAIALDVARRNKAFHRDVSPGNIMITPGGTAKLTDFDLARGADATRMTSTGMFLGKVRYAAPEVFLGKPDLRSDLYSLGIVTYEMLMGHVPFEADTPMEVMKLQESAEVPGLEKLAQIGDGTLARMVRRLLEKRPEDRYQRPTDLLPQAKDASKDTIVAAPPMRDAPPRTPLEPSSPRPRQPAGAPGGQGSPPRIPGTPQPSAAGFGRFGGRSSFALAGGVAIALVVGAVLLGSTVLGGSGDGGIVLPPSVTESTATDAVPASQTPREPIALPSDTDTPTVGPTNTPGGPTDTPVPPTDTPARPTDTPVRPTDTPVRPTDTPVPCADADNDGVCNSVDSCPGTPPGRSVGGLGCSQSQVDGDLDGICDPGAPSTGLDNCTGSDLCPSTPAGRTVDGNGCSDSQVDEDSDGVCNPGVPSDGPTGCRGVDLCPGTLLGRSVDVNGCSAEQ